MKLALLWREDPASDAGLQSGDDHLHLCFDWLAFERLRAIGVPVELIDDLLTWEDRERIEDAAGSLVRKVVSDPHVSQERVAGLPAAAVAEFQLRIELTNLLLCHAAVGRLAEDCHIDDVIALGRCPSTALLGARAAAAVTNGRSALDRSQEAWVPVWPDTPRDVPGWKRAVWRTTLSLGSARKVRVLAFPTAKVPAALSTLSGAALRHARLAVAALPGFTGRDAVRLAVRARVPFFALGGSRRATPAPVDAPVGELVPGQPQLDGAARVITRTVLCRALASAQGAAGTVKLLERFPACRTLLLPNTSTGAARMLSSWARERGVRCAVVQHGVYGWRDWGTGDRLADVILAWGPRVSDQIAASPEPRPRVVPVGVPGLSQRPAPQQRSLQHVLVATTNAPYGSAFGTHRFSEEYLSVIAPGLRRLLEGGVRLVLRHHPAEETWRYELLLRRLDLRIPISTEGSVAESVSRVDLVVSSPSSVAFEAAALGVPVLVWVGDIPLEMRRKHLLPPFRDELPEAFASEEDFASCAESLLRDPHSALRVARDLTAQLARYATPFDAERFEEALIELAS